MGWQVFLLLFFRKQFRGAHLVECSIAFANKVFWSFLCWGVDRAPRFWGLCPFFPCLLSSPFCRWNSLRGSVFRLSDSFCHLHSTVESSWWCLLSLRRSYFSVLKRPLFFFVVVLHSVSFSAETSVFPFVSSVPLALIDHGYNCCWILSKLACADCLYSPKLVVFSWF